MYIVKEERKVEWWGFKIKGRLGEGGRTSLELEGSSSRSLMGPHLFLPLQLHLSLPPYKSSSSVLRPLLTPLSLC